jgi:hypothetical protein
MAIWPHGLHKLNILYQLNSIHPNIQFTTGQEEVGHLPFLEIYLCSSKKRFFQPHCVLVSGKDQSSLTTLIHRINILDKASPKTKWANSEGLSRKWVTSEAEPQEKDPGSNQAKHFSTYFIPHVLKLSNNMSRTLTWNNCKIIHVLPQDRWSDRLGLNAT